MPKGVRWIYRVWCELIDSPISCALTWFWGGNVCFWRLPLSKRRGLSAIRIFFLQSLVAGYAPGVVQRGGVDCVRSAPCGHTATLRCCLLLPIPRYPHQGVVIYGSYVCFGVIPLERLHTVHSQARRPNGYDGCLRCYPPFQPRY